MDSFCSDSYSSSKVAADRRDFEARLGLAQRSIAAQNWTEAMDELLEILMRDKNWSDGLARKTYVAILDMMTKPAPKSAAKAAAPGVGSRAGSLEIMGKVDVPAADPVIEQYRRKLSMTLF